jgi:hypothetical protein
MRIIIIIITTGLICVSCGVKDEPKYQSQKSYSKQINII